MTIGIQQFEHHEQLARLRQGGEEALAALFAGYREQLLRMIALRLDCRVLSKVDGEDLLQDVLLTALGRMDAYLACPSVPIIVWLRQITVQVLVDTHRHYLGTQMRDVRQEVTVRRAKGTGTSSALLVAHLADSLTSPSQCAVRRELLDTVTGALDKLSEIDREVLVLRHLEDLSNNEVAEILGIDKFAASKRYLRALSRLRTTISEPP